MTQAAKIVNRLLADLSVRTGIGDQWDRLPHWIKDEIREKWIGLTESILEKKDEGT